MTQVAPVAITIGDAAGIGPESSLKVAASTDRPVMLVGCKRLLERVADTVGIDVALRAVGDPGECSGSAGVVDVYDMPMNAAAVRPGELSKECGQAVVDTIETATRFALDGSVSAVCSAPANKEAFNAAGHHYEGQTEIFAHFTNTTTFHTVLIGGPFKVSLVSAHCSMREAIARVNTERVERILQELDTAMRHHFGHAAPKIGVAGLNPHAGENGVLGTEEIDEVLPAIRNCRAANINVDAPMAADSLFAAAEAGRYDAVLAMYHDQGTIPLKRYGYVTYAAGLPIVRTTAGHGTAFDIAWEGKADPSLLQRAVTLADDLGQSHRNVQP